MQGGSVRCRSTIPSEVDAQADGVGDVELDEKREVDRFVSRLSGDERAPAEPGGPEHRVAEARQGNSSAGLTNGFGLKDRAGHMTMMANTVVDRPVRESAVTR